jgi:hypothetical protein
MPRPKGSKNKIKNSLSLQENTDIQSTPTPNILSTGTSLCSPSEIGRMIWNDEMVTALLEQRMKLNSKLFQGSKSNAQRSNAWQTVSFQLNLKLFDGKEVLNHLNHLNHPIE